MLLANLKAFSRIDRNTDVIFIFIATVIVFTSRVDKVYEDKFYSVSTKCSYIILIRGGDERR